jgi:glutamyl-tRNA synthetase
MTTSAETFNPVLVEFYEQVGYLPDAIVNYLLLLGWAHQDGKTEFFTRKEMLEQFDLERVNKGSASFDPKKLFAFQDRYMQLVPIPEKIERTLSYLERTNLVSSPASAVTRELVGKIVTEAGQRLIVAGDILSYDDFFCADDKLVYDDKAVDKHLRKPPGSEMLPKLRDVVASSEPFDAATLRKGVEGAATAASIKPGALSQTLRVAVTGKEIGFDAYGTLAILGRERCLARIDRTLERLNS